MLESATWRVRPGLRNTISVPVTNAREVVDGIRATIDDLDDSMVEIPIPVVSVFPGSTEQVKIHLDLPRTFPCGETTVQVRLTSTVDGAHLKSERVVLSVEALADVNMALSPRAARGARTAIRVDIENRGNTEAHIHLRRSTRNRAAHPNRTFRPPAAGRRKRFRNRRPPGTASFLWSLCGPTRRGDCRDRI